MVRSQAFALNHYTYVSRIVSETKSNMLYRKKRINFLRTSGAHPPTRKNKKNAELDGIKAMMPHVPVFTSITPKRTAEILLIAMTTSEPSSAGEKKKILSIRELVCPVGPQKVPKRCSVKYQGPDQKQGVTPTPTHFDIRTGRTGRQSEKKRGTTVSALFSLSAFAMQTKDDGEYVRKPGSFGVK